MKYLMILTVGLCLLLTAVPAVAQSAADEAAVREAIKQMEAAYNKHDAKALFSPVVEDYESWGGDLRGRAAWEKDYSARWERSKDAQWNITEEIGIVFVTPDVAIYKARSRNTGGIDENGNPLPPGKGLNAWVLVKKDGKWLRAHGMFSQPIEE